MCVCVCAGNAHSSMEEMVCVCRQCSQLHGGDGVCVCVCAGNAHSSMEEMVCVCVCRQCSQLHGGDGVCVCVQAMLTAPWRRWRVALL